MRNSKMNLNQELWSELFYIIRMGGDYVMEKTPVCDLYFSDKNSTF